jgi:hypothetical protein
MEMREKRLNAYSKIQTNEDTSGSVIQEENERNKERGRRLRGQGDSRGGEGWDKV